MEQYGIDWDGPVPCNDSCDDTCSVVVPETESPLGALDIDELDDVVLPLSDSTNYGIDLYEKTLDFVSTKLDIVL